MLASTDVVSINTQPVVESQMFNQGIEDALARRYSKSEKRNRIDELTFEFTKDKGLLHQYYNIREQESEAVYGINNYEGGETEFDRKGDILIVRKGNQCVGGVRLLVSTPRLRRKLPIEVEGIDIYKYFPELKQKEMTYGQISAFTILPEFRDVYITNKLFSRAYQKVISLNTDIIFVTAPILNARLYKQNCASMGLHNVKIHYDIDMPLSPVYEEVKSYLMSAIIDKNMVKTKNTLFKILETIH